MKRLLLRLAISIGVVGCSEDSARLPVEPEPTLLGHWKVVDVTGPQRAGDQNLISDFASLVRFGDVFITIEEDRLRATNERGVVGCRHKHESSIVVSADAIEIDGLPWSYLLGRETLQLGNSERTLYLERRDEVPDYDSWVIPYRSVFTRNTTHQSKGDIACGDGNLWVSGGPEGFDLTRIDLDNFVSYTMPQETINPTTIVKTRGLLLANSGPSDRIFLVEEEVTRPTPIALGDGLTALAGEGNFLWGVSKFDRAVYGYNLALDEPVGEVYLGFGMSLAGGLAHNGRLYIAASGVVTVFHIVLREHIVLEAESAFYLPGHRIVGIAHDGDDFWVNALDLESSNEAMRLHRIVPAAP